MKTVLLIGKFCQALQNIIEALHDDFQVKICLDNIEQVKVISEMNKPDMAVLCLGSIDGKCEEFFRYFYNMSPSVPVLSIGTKEECDIYNEYYDDRNIVKLYRPFIKTELLYLCNRIIFGEDYLNNLDNNRKTVMIIDDSPIMLRSIRQLISKEYKVIAATSGTQAMKILADKTPDLILLDYEMPGMDGKQVFKQFQLYERLKNIPVIFLTAVNDRETTMSILELCPAGFILKPPDKAKLFEVIEKNLS